MATATTNILLRYSYPKVPGDQFWSTIDVYGPAAYQPLVPGSPGPPVVAPTGGQRITAKDFGLEALDLVVAMGSNDGQHTVIVVADHAAIVSEFDAVLLAWMNLTGGQASGNLSQSFVRLLGIGR